MKKILILFIFFFACGCGQRIAGNPSKFSYQEYSNYDAYNKNKLEEAEQKVKEINPQSTISNPQLIGNTSCDFNRSCRTRGRNK